MARKVFLKIKQRAHDDDDNETSFAAPTADESSCLEILRIFILPFSDSRAWLHMM